MDPWFPFVLWFLSFQLFQSYRFLPWYLWFQLDLYRPCNRFLPSFPSYLFLQWFLLIQLYQWFHLYLWFLLFLFHPLDQWFPCSLFDQEILLYPVFLSGLFYLADLLNHGVLSDLAFLSDL